MANLEPVFIIDEVEFRRLTEIVLREASIEMDTDYAQNLVQSVLECFSIEVNNDN